jgi:two-component system, NarL family, response regulator LiaR
MYSEHVEKGTMTIRILLVDDHAVVRAGLHAVLETEPGFEVVGEAETGEGAVIIARKLQPDVVVLDLLLPDLDGVAVTQHIRAARPETQVVILTSIDKEDASVVRAIQAGAIGYVLKSANVSELVHAIRAGADGQVHLSARAGARLMQKMRSSRNHEMLTDREWAVLRGIANGQSNKEIAVSLNIALTTVKSHVRAILEKLGVDSRTQAALHALRYDLLSTGELQVA